MSLRFLAIALLLLGFLLLAALSLAAPGFALDTPVGTSPAGRMTGTGPQQFALPIPLPDPAGIELPPGASPSQASRIAQHLLAQAAQPVLEELRRLEQENQVTGVELRPELGVIRFVAADADTLQARLGAGGVVAAQSAEQSCASESAAAFTEIVRSRIELDRVQAAQFQGAATTNPTIYYSMPPGELARNTLTYVYGLTQARVPVDLRILRGGGVAGSGRTTSDAAGNYRFYPVRQPCYQIGYEWVLQPGDVIEVTVAGNTVSTTVVPLSAWMDPFTDTVAGTTAPGREVLVTAAQSQPGACDASQVEKLVTAAADGSFTTDWNSTLDFDHSASSTVCSRDANGNGACLYTEAFHVALQLTGYHPTLTGQVKPFARYQVSRVRKGTAVLLATGDASASGDLVSYFYDMQPNDIYRLWSDGRVMEYEVLAFNASLDPATDRVSGSAGPQVTIKATFVKRGYGTTAYGLRTLKACGTASACRSRQTDASGAFDIAAGFDVARGDTVSLVAYDANGNWQELPVVNAPAIYIDPVAKSVQGYWYSVTSYSLSVRVLGPGGDLKGTGSPLYLESNGSFGGSVDGTVAAGDTVEVSDWNGLQTETMIVQPLSARFEAASSQIVGASNGGDLVALPWHQPCIVYYYGSATAMPDACQEREISPGAFGVTFPGFQARGGDTATVSLRGPDGHYTLLNSHTFQVRWSQMEPYPYLSVWTKTPNATVQASAIRGPVARPMDCYASSPGYASCNLPNASERLQAGDVIHVITSDGDQLALTLPEFTAAGTNLPPSVFGNAPAGREVSTGLYERVRVLEGGPYVSSTERTIINARADANNTYRASYAGLWAPATSSASLCWPPRPASPCAGISALYCSEAGHRVYIESSPPVTPASDSFELDDSAAAASTYAGPQHHTFSADTDADWVRFEVPAAAVARDSSYRIETFTLASGAMQDITLFAPDGQTAILAWQVRSKWGQPSATLWKPGAAGVYYVRVQRPAKLGVPFCGDVYDLRIDEVQRINYLPLLLH